MKHHYIEGEWINALMYIFADLDLDIQKITKNIKGFEDDRLIEGNRLEVGAARKMWHRADTLAQDPLLGFKVGSVQNYRSIGVLAPVIWHSPCVRVALRNIAAFQTLISESGTYRFDEIEDGGERVSYCEYVVEPSGISANVHQILAVVVATIGIIKVISNNIVEIKRLYLPPSLNASLLSKSIGSEVVSRDGNLVICFSTEKFDQPLLGCDSNLYQINMAYAEELLCAKKAGVALIDSVKSAIETGGFTLASIDYVELSLGLHKRTLQRNLAEQGTSFRQLKEEVLKTQTVYLLRERGFEIESLATHLGYSEPSAFHRAFKSWFGVTPRKFCHSHQSKLSIN